jgi:hypothetical protein
MIARSVGATSVLMLTPCLSLSQDVSETDFEQGKFVLLLLSKISVNCVLLFVVSDGPVDDEALFDDNVTVLPDEAELHARPLSLRSL